MSPGTLYGAIARLDARGWIEEIQTSNYRRRPFRLTRAGADALRKHLEFLGQLSSLGSRRIRSFSKARKGAVAK
jgi:DNA-binding PadR family transcriptional regulator